MTQDEQYVMNTLKGLVGKDKAYRADIAATLGTRIANHLEFYSKDNAVEKPLIERISKIVTEKIFATDICYNMVKSIYNSNPNKFKLMMLNKELVEMYQSESMDPDGRGHRNLIRMMMEDGFFKYLPKGDDNWVNFLKPFLKLSRKEKTKFRNKK